MQSSMWRVAGGEFFCTDGRVGSPNVGPPYACAASAQLEAGGEEAAALAGREE